MRAASLALRAAALLALAPAAARAADPPAADPPAVDPPQITLRLSYNLGPGAQNCPPEQALHDEVARRMGYDPFTPAAADHVVATLNRSGRLFSGTLELFDSSGKRTWRKSYAFRGQKDEDCAALDMAMGIDIAVAFIDFSLPPTAATAPSPPPLPEPPPPEPPPPAEAPRPSSSPPPKDELPPSLPLPRSEPLRLNLGIASALALRTASRPFAFNFMADAGLRYRSFSGALEFRWTSPIRANVDKDGRAWGSAMQFTGGLVPCGHIRAFFVCGMGQVTAVVWQGSPGTSPQSLTLPTAAAGVRLGGDVPLPWWQRLFALRLSADVLATLLHAEIYVDGAEKSLPSWTTPGLTVALGVGFVSDFAF